MTILRSSQLWSLLFLIFTLEASAIDPSNDEAVRFLEGLSASNTDSSSQMTSNQTSNSPSMEDPEIAPCQNLTSSGNDDHNIFEENDDFQQWEYRYLECGTDDSPCSTESSCCECTLLCRQQFANCTIPPSPSGPPISENGTVDNNSPDDILGRETSIKTSFTSSSGLDWIAAFASIIILISCCINALFIFGKLRKRGLDHSRSPIVIDTDDALTLPPADGAKDPVYVAKVKRHEDIICKFHFRTIPYKALDGSSRSFGSGGDDSHTENRSLGDLECPISPAGSVQRRLQKQKRRRSSKLSFWRRQVRKDECCICLENYGQGDTICVPLSSSCSHMFHEECVVAWLQHNNRCPLCRVDLMKEVKVVDEPVLPSLDHSAHAEASETPSTPIPTEITPTEEQMEEPHSSESDEEAQNGEDSNENEEGDALQPTEESSVNGQGGRDDGDRRED